MKAISTLLIVLSLLSVDYKLNAQTTADLFSLEGLSINAYHFNFFDGTYSTSYTVIDRKPDISGGDTIKYIHNEYGHELLLRVQDEKVYLVSQTISTDYLIYDFGVSVGHIFSEGLYQGYEVVAVGSITLLNGETRKAIDVQSGSTTYNIVEGIGDIQHGLVPNFNDFEGSDFFVCASINNQLLIESPSANPTDCEIYSCIKPIPQIELLVDDFTVTAVNNSRYGDVVSWDFGDGNTSSEFSPIHTYDTPGCYTITFDIGNDCYQNQIIESFSTSICFRNAWEEIYASDTLRSSIYGYDLETDYVYNQDILYKVTNAGQDWEKLSITTVDDEKRIINIIRMWDENRGLIGARGQKGLLVTADGGLTWNTPVEEAYWTRNFITEQSGKAYVAGGVYIDKFYRTSDFGQNWDVLTINSNNHQFYNFLYAEDNLVYSHAFRGFWDFMDWRLGKSTDNGDTWTFLELPFNARHLQFVDKMNGFGSDEDHVWYTSDGGQQWIKISTLNDISSIHFNSPTHGWVINSSGEVLYSSDRFETFIYTACGSDNIRSIQTLSDTTAMTFTSTSELGTKKFLFDQNLISDCTMIVDLDDDGFNAEEDCDDSNANINSDQTEIPYNGVDDDCDPMTLDDDLDQDGFVLADDCNDNNPDINSGQTETPYNGIDEDCNPTTLDDDLDQDGFILANDCDDNNPNINSDADEVAYNGMDDDCDPMTLDDDLDQDGFLLVTDCDDNNPTVNSGQAETLYNGIDDDCNPATLDDDLDQDGFLLADDCDDTNPNINPNRTEAPYNGIDDDCNPATLDDDLDQDGFLIADDCDDMDAQINPDAEEIVNNGIDEDCDGMDLTSSVHQIADASISIFPNPVSDILYINITGNLSYEVRVYNSNGRLLKHSPQGAEINISSIPSGLYYIELIDLKTGQKIMEQIVKN